MKRTHVSTLVAFVLAGIVAGYLIDLAIVSAGANAIVPPLSLPITLTGVGALVVGFAWPVRRAVKGKATKHLDPFRAMRTAVLAKACSLSGALVFGFGLGITVFLLTRSVVPSAETVWVAFATAIGAGLLLVGGLVAGDQHGAGRPVGGDGLRVQGEGDPLRRRLPVLSVRAGLDDPELHLAAAARLAGHGHGRLDLHGAELEADRPIGALCRRGDEFAAQLPDHVRKFKHVPPSHRARAPMLLLGSVRTRGIARTARTRERRLNFPPNFPPKKGWRSGRGRE